MDAVTPGDDEAQPSPGDYSLCLNCAAILVFEKNMRVRLVTMAEMETMEFRLVSVLLTARSKILLLQDAKDKGLI